MKIIKNLFFYILNRFTPTESIFHKKYFDKTEIPNYLQQVQSIPKAIDNFEVTFTQNNTELSLVRRFFDSTVMGTNNSSYNLKITKNITIT